MQFPELTALPPRPLPPRPQHPDQEHLHPKPMRPLPLRYVPLRQLFRRTITLLGDVQILVDLSGILPIGQTFVTVPVPLLLLVFCSLQKHILRALWDHLLTLSVVLGLLLTLMSFSRMMPPLEHSIQFDHRC